MEAKTTYRGFTNPWPHRRFVVQAIRGEIKRQFARSTLGALWLILHPLARAVIFALVFSEILLARLPGVPSPYAYTIYLMAGMAGWGLFSDVLTRSVTIFIEYAAMLKKAPISHLCIPAIGCGGALFSHVVLLVAMALVTSLLGSVPGLAWLALIPAAAVLLLLGFGIGLILGVFNVFKRDVAQLIGIVLQLWFWLTPIVYVSDIIPKKYQWIAEFNPIWPVIRVYQDAMVYGTYPQLETLAVPLALGVALSLAALLLLRRASSDMIDSL